MAEEIVDFTKAKRIMADKIKEGVPNAAPTDVFRIEIKIHPIDEMAWIAQQKSKVKIFGSNQDNTASIAGIGQAAYVQGRSITNLRRIFSLLRQYLKPQYPYLQWYGGLCFDPQRLSKEWKDFGAYRFIVPRFELASEASPDGTVGASSMIFCCNIVGKVSHIQIAEILNQLVALEWNGKKAAYDRTPFLRASKRIDFPSQKQWDDNIETVLKAIAQGSLEKIVLARQTRLKFAKKLDPWAVLRRLFDVTPNSYHFCFEFGQTAFLGASPERLYRKYGHSIISEAIAGTTPKGRGVSEDNALKEKLLASSKDNREHAFVVETIDRSFQKLCKDYQHADRPEILTLGNGHHLRTSFEGRLKERIFDEEIIKSLHPTPAVGGSPSEKAMKTLARLEGFQRGWYTGLIGYVGLDWSEFVVGIRSALIRDKEMTVYAGAGIVEGSHSYDEWQEIENKIENFIKIF